MCLRISSFSRHMMSTSSKAAQFTLLQHGYGTNVVLALNNDTLTVTHQGGKNHNCYFPADKRKVYMLDDILACNLLTDAAKDTNDFAYFSILGYASHRSSQTHNYNNNTIWYEKMELTFRVSSEKTAQDNLKVALGWRHELMDKLASRRQKSVDFFSHDEIQRPNKPLLILVNPHSGSKKAMHICKTSVLPLLDEANVTYEVVVTQRPNHGRDLVATTNQLLTRWSGIVIVSGDGLLHEVLQGLFQRPDWREARKMPLGIVPGGSGNGLARSLAHFAQERYDNHGIELSTLNIVKGHLRPMDLTCVTTASNKTLYSFLSVGWGFFADCDIESERIRFMGEVRFTIWPAIRLANLRTYRARLSYRPVAVERDDGGSSSDGSSISESEKSIHVPSKLLRAPNIDEEIDPNDPNWVTTVDDFVTVYCVSQPWVGSTILMAPESRLDDGLLWLVMIRKGIPKSQLLKVLLSFENGHHVSMDHVEMIPVSAFRLEPLTKGSYVTVDGELIEYGPVQAEVLPSYVRVMSK